MLYGLGYKHKFCLRHFFANFKKEFKDKAFKDLLWNAVRATTRHEFEYNMFEMLKLNDKFVAWLIRYDPLC